MRKKLPALPNNKGRVRKIDSQKGYKVTYTIVDEIKIKQHNAPNKAIYLQKMQFEEDKRIEFRFGYYIIGHKPGMQGKWVWGQYCLMIPKIDLIKLLAAAKKKNWL